MKNSAVIPKLREALADPSEPENVRIIAMAYWRALILVSLVLLVCSLTYSYGQFQGGLQVFDVSTASATGSGPFSRPELDQAVAAFDSRALHYAALKAQPLSDPDPSQ